MICVPDSVFYFILQLSFLMGNFFVNSSQAAANFVSLAAAFFCKKVAGARTPLRFFFREKSRSGCRFGCKRPRSGFLPLSTFCGCAPPARGVFLRRKPIFIIKACRCRLILRRHAFCVCYKVCNGVQREHNKNLIMDCQSYTKYRPNETTGGIFVSWRRKEELPTGA